MTQLRLNSLTVRHVHQELVDLVDVNAVIEQNLFRGTIHVRVHVWQMTIKCTILCSHKII